MARNYPQFDEGNGFQQSISNLSLVEFVDDEVSDSDDTEIKDRNNNGNNRYVDDVVHESGFVGNEPRKKNDTFEMDPGVSRRSIPNAIHWEREDQSPVALSPDNITNEDAGRQPLDCNELESPPTVPRLSTQGSESELLIPHLVEGENSSDHDSDHSSRFGEASDSSHDKSEGRLLVKSQKSTKVRTSRKSRNEISFQSQRNLNENNNKKKKKSLSEASNTSSDNGDKTYSSESSTRHSDGSLIRGRYSKGRFRSVQLSSLRTLTNINIKPGSWTIKNFKYGQRLVEKNGQSNIHIMDKGKNLCSRYISDIFTTLLDSSWGWVLFITSLVYIGHWIIFGLVYWAFAIYNNDYEKIMGPSSLAVNETSTDSLIEPCVFDVYDFASAFLFSMESETTIGYGSRTITTQCPSAVICLTIQCIISAIFDTWIIGLCFSRMARPDARTITTMFSKTAVVCKRDGKKCLLVRFANLRKSLLVNVSVCARLISLRSAHCKEKTDGYQKMLEQRKIAFSNSTSALLTAPVEYCHIIDKESPLYDVKQDLYNCKDGSNYFELVVVVTGTLESTGLTMHAQTSYLSSEILYGYRFFPVISESYERQKYIVNFKNFHQTFPEMISNSNPNETVTTFLDLDVSSPLVEETENELSTNDDVFCSDGTAPQAESVV